MQGSSQLSSQQEYARRKMEEDYFGRGLPLDNWQSIEMEIFV